MSMLPIEVGAGADAEYNNNVARRVVCIEGCMLANESPGYSLIFGELQAKGEPTIPSSWLTGFHFRLECIECDGCIFAGASIGHCLPGGNACRSGGSWVADCRVLPRAVSSRCFLNSRSFIHFQFSFSHSTPVSPLRPDPINIISDLWEGFYLPKRG
jgi:hypothetical protein